MTLHDKVVAEEAIGSATYLIAKAKCEINRAWAIMIKSEDYSHQSDFSKIYSNLKDALDDIVKLEIQFRDEKNDLDT